MQCNKRIDFTGFARDWAADRVATVMLAADCMHGHVNPAGYFCILGPMADGMKFYSEFKGRKQWQPIAQPLAMTPG